MSDTTICEGTELYHRTMAADYGDLERNALMKSEWTPTPWMIDVQVDDNRDAIRHWCYHNLGRESSPMHGHEGSWKQASVTLLGRSWFGFKTEAMMERFKSIHGRNGGGGNSNRRAVSDGTDPRHECDNIYTGDGKCICWRCGKETPLTREFIK